MTSHNVHIMKPFTLILYFFSLYFVAGISCKKPKNISGGGKGGNSTIIARAEHESSLLDSAVIYIKYGTHDEPANGIYDDSLIVATNSQGVFSNLTAGNYYLFAEALHYPYGTLKGAAPWTIESNQELDTVNIGTGQNPFAFPTWWHPL